AAPPRSRREIAADRARLRGEVRYPERRGRLPDDADEPGAAPKHHTAGMVGDLPDRLAGDAPAALVADYVVCRVEAPILAGVPTLRFADRADRRGERVVRGGGLREDRGDGPFELEQPLLAVP